jgi:hypothetical protein
LFGRALSPSDSPYAFMAQFSLRVLSHSSTDETG